MLVRCLILILLCFQSTHIFAQSNDESLCDIPSRNCLAWVRGRLEGVENYSMYWYKLKLMQLDSLLTVKEFTILQRELDAFKDNQDLPPFFLLSVKIYQAKLDMVHGRRQQAMSLLTLSIEQLKQVNQLFYSPIRMIMIANLMQDLGQYERSLTLLEQMKNDFSDSKDSYLKLELYGNLGHGYRHLKEYGDALASYKNSLQFAVELGNEQQISILYTHLARIYQRMNKIESAEQGFIEALMHAKKDAQEATVISAKVNLAYFYIQQLELEKARMLSKDIDGAKVEPHQRSIWLAINQVLKTDS
jgi:tetratricopeptide (TPR) repeat protein